ncbi:MAG TPA: hypothetical protein VHD90_27170 [Phototrophicaceae bacterium]|nr:hypothetical protein [Phototrophicaceae bacterium]
MTVRYYITPYDPEGWRDPDADDSTRPHSDLRVNVNDFDKQLRQRWHEAEASRGSWQFNYPDGQGIGGSLIDDNEGDHQIAAIEVGRGFNEFVLWYRSFIPPEYPLFLFLEGQWNSLQLTSRTPLEEIAAFTGL